MYISLPLGITFYKPITKVHQLLARGPWFSPGTPVSSITKTGRHDIAEILLKVALKTKKSNQLKMSVKQSLACN
jgi:hypothetical protein